MKLWKYRLWRLRVWLVRIIFFPIWLPLAGLKLMFTPIVKPNPCGCFMSGNLMVTDECDIHNEEESEPVPVLVKKPEPEPKSPWIIELIRHDDKVFGAIPVIVETSPEGLVLNGKDFHVPCAVTLKGQRAVYNGKTVGYRDYKMPLIAAYGDILKVQHFMDFKEEFPDEPIKNKELRRLQLMTSYSSKVRDGSFAADHFAIIDSDGQLEGAGTKVRVKFIEWYPKAIWFRDDQSVKVSYDTTSALFLDIQKKTNAKHHNAKYGPEFVFELEGGELVTMYCGSNVMRRQSLSVHREKGHECMLTVQKMKTTKFAWSTTKFTPIKILWTGEPIHELGNKRLWNIIQALEKGQWASGKKAVFHRPLAEALEKEYSKRQRDGEFTKKKIKRIKKKNKEYEAKFCTHGRDPHKTYPKNCPRCKDKKILMQIEENVHRRDRYISRKGWSNY